MAQVQNENDCRLYARSIYRLIAIVAFGILIGCGEAARPEICYSQFSPREKPEFKHGLTEALADLHNALVDAYLNADSVVDIPIIEAGSVYLSSTCEYVSLVRQNLDKNIIFSEISEEEFARQVELTSESGRVIWMERN
jgi:hypothetical protein|tara:strand:+ start:1544 stop:1960 length:417 start_codon:yes stop_codon:yes gene_type:complete